MVDSDLIDLRSDTVTRPTREMRRAMAAAQVGDDVFGEDPTVRRLEEMAADRMGAEAAVFVPTGTMGNQVALHVHARPGREVILDGRSHIATHEKGAMAVLSGLLPRPVGTALGAVTPEEVVAALSADDVVHTPTGLVALENTHNMAGGRVMPLATTRAIQAVARGAGIPVHLDGARIFNAALALGESACELAAGFDSVMFCLSKGLGAPVGSMLCGDAAFVAEARKIRKLFGGGMRQVGVLAAAGIVALERMAGRLDEDHRVAASIAQGLAETPGVELEARPETNIVMFRVGAMGPGEGAAGRAGLLVEGLRNRAVFALALGPDRVRMVTHFDLPENAAVRAVAAVREVLAEHGASGAI